MLMRFIGITAIGGSPPFVLAPRQPVMASRIARITFALFCCAFLRISSASAAVSCCAVRCSAAAAVSAALFCGCKVRFCFLHALRLQLVRLLCGVLPNGGAACSGRVQNAGGLLLRILYGVQSFFCQKITSCFIIFKERRQKG